MPWSTVTWLVSVAAVAASGSVAAAEGHWRRNERLHVGFAAHGGMWGDAVLLPIVNGLVVPWIEAGWWLWGAVAAGVAASITLHAWWHGGQQEGLREHMWPTRPTGRWWRDLSWAGWCHVVYVALEMALLAAYAVTPLPAATVVLISMLLSAHVPLGVLVPAWRATGHLFRNDLWQTGAAVTATWVVALLKTVSR